MSARRLFVLVVLAAAVLGPVDGTGAASAVDADRSFSAAVATDATAYLGVGRSTSVQNGTRTLSVRVTNRLGDDAVRLSVSVNGNTTVAVVAPDDARTFEFSPVECDDELRVVADSADVHVDLSRSVPCGASE